MVRWGRRAGRQALVKVVGSGSREQVVVLEAAMVSEMREGVTGENAVIEWVGRGRGVRDRGS